MIVASQLAKAFGLRPVLRGISFNVPHGTVTALLGPNGSGKTTLIRILAALSRPTAGTVTIGGWKLPDEASRVRAQLGVVSHLPLLYDDLTAEENLQFFARLYNVDQAAVRVKEALERVGISRRARDPLRTFSRGMQQRLAIARAMLHDPAVFLLDEPYTGLDVDGTAMLDGLLEEWKAQGRTILIATHDLGRATTISDHVLILSQGKMMVDSPTSDIPNLFEAFASATA